jgi:nucleoid DNA-binding protein
MNRSELIFEIAKRSKVRPVVLTRQQVELVIDLLLELMTEELSRPDGAVRLGEFGVLEVQKRVRRQGKSGLLLDGRSGAVREVSRVAYHFRFRPSRKLRQELQKNGSK